MHKNTKQRDNLIQNVTQLIQNSIINEIEMALHGQRALMMSAPQRNRHSHKNMCFLFIFIIILSISRTEREHNQNKCEAFCLPFTHAIDM